MKVEQIRSANIAKPFQARAYCISHIYIDGVYFCDAIEDYDRGLDEGMDLATIKRIKIASKTAIPTGHYTVKMGVESPTFRKKEYYLQFCRGMVPRLDPVKGYSGILLHPGIDENSSAGCVIVGENKQVGKVINSKKTFERLYAKFWEAFERGETIEYIITRKYICNVA